MNTNVASLNKRSKLNIILVDDNKAFLDGLESLFRNHDRFRIVAKYNSGNELLEHVSAIKSDIILLDIEMPGLNGIETAKRINQKFPEKILIAITMYQDKVYLRELICSGFRGFVSKTEVTERLETTIESVINQKFTFPHQINL